MPTWHKHCSSRPHKCADPPNPLTKAHFSGCNLTPLWLQPIFFVLAFCLKTLKNFVCGSNTAGLEALLFMQETDSLEIRVLDL